MKLESVMTPIEMEMIQIITDNAHRPVQAVLGLRPLMEKRNKIIIDKVCHSSDAVVKLARAGVPEKDIKDNFIKFMKEL